CACRGTLASRSSSMDGNVNRIRFKMAPYIRKMVLQCSHRLRHPGSSTAGGAMFSSGNVTVYVADMDRAVRFYSEVLGLKLAYRFGNHWASIELGKGL